MFNSDVEIRAIDTVLHNRLASPQMMEAIHEAVKSSLNETVQRVQVSITEIAERVTKVFKDDLKASLGKATDDWLSAQGGLLEVVPSGTKLLKQIGNYKLVVVEYPPQVRTLHFANEHTEGGGVGHFKLALPYTVFLVWVNTLDKNVNQCATVRMGYLKKPLDSLQSIIYPSNLPNTKNDFSICMGGTWTDQISKQTQAELHGQAPKKPIAKIVEDAVSYFWNSTFNNDIPDQFRHGVGLDPRISSLNRWARETEIDPLFMLKIDWRGGKHLSQLFSESVSQDIKIQIGPIVDRAVGEAGRQLMEYFRGLSTGSINAQPSQRAIGTFRTKLYDHLFRVCQELLGNLREHERERVREELQKEFATKQPKSLENTVSKLSRYESGDYMYHPPKYGVW